MTRKASLADSRFDGLRMEFWGIPYWGLAPSFYESRPHRVPVTPHLSELKEWEGDLAIFAHISVTWTDRTDTFIRWRGKDGALPSPEDVLRMGKNIGVRYDRCAFRLTGRQDFTDFLYRTKHIRKTIAHILNEVWFGDGGSLISRDDLRNLSRLYSKIPMVDDSLRANG